MNETGQDLFDVRINETGKLYLQKFALVGVVIMSLITITSIASIYFWIKAIRYDYYPSVDDNEGIRYWHHFLKPYLNIIVSVAVLLSNWIYTSFPRRMLKALREKDEVAANLNFRWLYRGAIIFVTYLVYSVFSIVEGFIS